MAQGRKKNPTEKKPQIPTNVGKTLLAKTQIFELCAIRFISALAQPACEGPAKATIPKFSGNHREEDLTIFPMESFDLNELKRKRQHFRD